MKSLQWSISFIGTLLLALGIIGGDSLGKEEMDRPLGLEQTIISVKEDQEEAFFTLEDMRVIKEQEKTYLALCSTEIEEQTAWVVGTNSAYPDFEKLQFYGGSFFNPIAQDSAAKVVVIDERLAWDTFGSLQVVGDTIEIYEEKLKIIGVIAQDRSLLGLLCDPGIGKAYLPLNTLLTLHNPAPISTLQIRNQEQGQNHTKAEEILTKLHKNPEDYTIIDRQAQTTLIAQKPRILMFIIGLACLLALLQILIQQSKTLVAHMQRECQDQYLGQVLKNSKKKLGQTIGIMALLLMAMGYIWVNIQFEMYIPPENLPNDRIEVTFYLDMFKNEIQQQVLNRNHPASFPEIRLDKAQGLSNWLFYPGLLLGIPLVWIGLILSKGEKEVPVSQTLFLCCMTFILALGIGTIATHLAGITVNLRVMDLAILFSFLSIYALKYANHKEKEV